VDLIERIKKELSFHRVMLYTKSTPDFLQ